MASSRVTKIIYNENTLFTWLEDFVSKFCNNIWDKIAISICEEWHRSHKRTTVIVNHILEINKYFVDLKLITLENKIELIFCDNWNLPHVIFLIILPILLLHQRISLGICVQNTPLFFVSFLLAISDMPCILQLV